MYERDENGRLLVHGGKEMAADGPWHAEPDRVEFEHEGFPCLLVRNGMAAWCGYVGVPPGHAWHGVGYDDVRTVDDGYPSVHGGLTYANSCSEPICHTPKDGHADDVWWLGFDCVHSGDTWPESDQERERKERWLNERGLARMTTDVERGWFAESYKTVAYARAETERLAVQAAALRSIR